MRKVSLMLIGTLLLLGVGSWASKPVSAIESPDTGVPAMARFYPAHTLFFATASIDAGHLDILDSLTQTVMTGLSDFGIPALNLRLTLSFALGLSVDDMVDWLGDHAAVGVVVLSPEGQVDPNSVYMVVELENRAKVEAFLIDKGIAAPQGERTSSYTLLQSPDSPMTIELYENYMVIAMTPRGNLMQTRETRLTSNPNYQQLMTSLPASSYNILVYADFAAILEATNFEDGQSFPTPIMVDSTQLAVGLTVLNGDTLAIDSAQLPGPDGGLVRRAIPNPEFMRYIPGDAMAVVHASDFTTFYNTSVTAIRAISDYNYQTALQFQQAMGDLTSPGATATPLPPPPDPVDQVEAALQQVGIDLHADLLSWTTGDYALFARVDAFPIVRDVLTYQINLDGRYDFGVVIEATDSTQASAFKDKMVALTEQMVAATATTNVTIGAETMGTTDVTTVKIDVEVPDPFHIAVPGQSAPPPTLTIPVELVLGANEDIFFLMTRDAAEQVLNGGATLVDDETYLAAREVMLPNTTSMWYTDGEGTLLATGANPIVILTLLGPAIGNVFENILEQFDTVPGQPTLTPSLTPSPTPTPTPDMDAIDAQLAPLRYAIDTLKYGTISATVNDDGVALLRFTITLSRKLEK